jgi:hypothetical protein
MARRRATKVFFRPSYPERFPIRWNHLIGKKSLKIKELEHVVIEKIDQLFRNILSPLLSSMRTAAERHEARWSMSQ